MNPSGMAWSGFAILCLVTVLVGAVILWSRRSGSAAVRLPRPRAGPVARVALAITGLVCLGLAGGAELRAFRAGAAPGPATWRRVVEAAPEAEPGAPRFHLLAAVYDGPAGTGPRSMHEAVLPVRGQRIEHDLPSLGLTLRLRVEGENAPEGEVEHDVFARHSWFQHRGWLRPEPIDLGDGRPFRVMLAMDAPSRVPPLGLVRRPGPTVVLLGRPLSSGDELEPAPAAEALARAFRPLGLPPVGYEPVRSGDPVGRVAQCINVWGLLLVMSGLLFLLLGLIRFVQAAAVAIVVPLVLTSALIRSELALGESGLEREDPAERVRALTRVAGATLFPARATQVLLKHFSEEGDEEVRADLTDLTVGLPFHDRTPLLERAAADPSELVRRAASRGRQQKPRASD